MVEDSRDAEPSKEERMQCEYSPRLTLFDLYLVNEDDTLKL